MEDNGNTPGLTVATPQVNRLRASGPILLLAILFVLGAFLTWYFTWFGRELSDADIAQYLVDVKHPRRVQHALLQVQQRIERGDPTAKQWYPQIMNLSGSPETEFRLTVAWLMGFDRGSEEFHQALRKMVRDPEPIVRRNAALALVRFNDPGGHRELIEMLKPYEEKATVEGTVNSTLQVGSNLTRGTLLVRIAKPDNALIEVRSPLPGKVERIITPGGTKVSVGETLLTINADEETVWEALRGLSLVGSTEELPLIEAYAQGGEGQSARIKQQATQTIKAIQTRASNNGKPNS
jgi:hypothetical protein